MKQIFNLLLVCVLLSQSVFAQRNCGTMHRHEQLIAEHPEILDQIEQIEQFTKEYEIQQTENGARVVVTIPVVVHVVYNTTTQNISDAQIQSQINILNQDFAALNSDKTLVPSAFASLVANTNIQFCLAQRTPTGAATTGIVRKSTTTTSIH